MINACGQERDEKAKMKWQIDRRRFNCMHSVGAYVRACVHSERLCSSGGKSEGTAGDYRAD